MEFDGAFNDPLKIKLKRQTRILLSKLPPGSPHANAFNHISSAKELLETLSLLLAVPSLTLSVASAFRPLLIPLCAQWLTDDENIEEKLVAICLLIQPHEELFSILSQLLRKPKLQRGLLALVPASQSLENIDRLQLHRLLLAYYRIMLANRLLPDSMSWPLSALSTLFWTPHPDTGVRLLAIRCYAVQSGMGEAEREKLEAEIMGPPCGIDCQIDYGQDIDGNNKEIDGWIMPALEAKRIIDARNSILLDSQDCFSFNDDDEPMPLQLAAFSPLVVNIHGIMLLRSPGPSDYLPGIIHTPIIVKSLRSLASHVSLRLPTLLTSPPSSGKSLLLSYLAASLHPGVTNQIVTIHLADTSLDPRSLLGAYVSSPTEPGTFEWREGVIIRAMREGRWVVLKDIDRGTSEVLGIIKPLVESLGIGKWIGGVASLNVPGRDRVNAHEDFALFATRSFVPSRSGRYTPPTFFGANKFHEIVIEPPSPPELKAIIRSKFPLLGNQVAHALILLWDTVRAHGSVASTRDVGYRELQKFCARVENLFKSSHYSSSVTASGDESVSLSELLPNSNLREEVYLEARDVFFGAGALTASARAHVEAVAATVAQHLGLEPERCDWVLHRRLPDLQVKKDTDGKTTCLMVGRTILLARPTKSEISPLAMRPFALHRPAVLLLSRIAASLSFNEPILLTGETGTGKTSIVTYIASVLNRPLISLNLSHQTESSDLIGGFKPMDTRIPAALLQEKFLDLFGETFSRRKNAKFEESVRKAVMECKWKRVVGLWRESVRLARDRLQAKQNEQLQHPPEAIEDTEAPRKRRKMGQNDFMASGARWSTFEQDVNDFEIRHVQGKAKFVFGFVEGPLVKALRSGHWILLDEINLASAETLECISELLDSPDATITLTEQGALEPVPRHPDFRLFACMNPATDVGKKDLPASIRCRFTEIDVAPPDADKDTLLSIITQYIGHNAVGDKTAILNVAEFYLAVKQLAQERQIADGSNHTPYYSIRTLSRALTFAADTASVYGLRRALWEGCLMAFTMILDTNSAEIATALAQQHLLAGVRNPRSFLSKEPPAPRSQPADNFVKFGHIYLAKGPLPEDSVDDYIITPSVEKKLVDLARIMVTRRFPVLIEGPTSSGKTSSVEYLAHRTGHRFIRINNHEHTDIQEYLGSYVSDPVTGKLVFKDGLLVRALRDGHWIVLDELNLAPTDVLEALNRLLDDNRELVIPETQEVVKPHPNFMLFATQNPPGLYAGRKVLSRAFRSRFLEVHFQDVPQAELEYILCHKCQIAPSYASKIVNVFRELQKRRQSCRVFESRHGFATLRDLFRWAGRDAIGYQQLAENGYMLLGERARRDDDKQVVKQVIENELRVKIDENMIYSIHNPTSDHPAYLGCSIPSSPLIWTSGMQRLFTLVARALRFNEPVLLVGETGSGKTSVCQIYADAVARQLHSLNCHQNTETADLIGGLRPVRNRTAVLSETLRYVSSTLRQMGVCDISEDEISLLASVENLLRASKDLSVDSRTLLEECRRKMLRLNAIFEWQDGPLIEAMRLGDVFLLDEISLADDSVLERLNSVLEPARTIILAERGGDDIEHAVVKAGDTFKIIATMNPGGDYGKKELSPALRNRFTEIWVPPVHERADLELIISSSWADPSFIPYTNRILDFVDWLVARVGDRSIFGLRDILAWVNFSNSVFRREGQISISTDCIFHHAAYMTMLDGLSSLPQLASYPPQALSLLKTDAFAKLQELAPLSHAEMPITRPLTLDETKLVQFGPFTVTKGSNHSSLTPDFYFEAPTTLRNALRVARACQLHKAILLEGSPGVGKTSLVTALAGICGHALYRINLSDQTDLVDLFGSDLPVEGGHPGEFAWKDAGFLKAMQEGHWVLLDELNLAPQAILEGLNAVLDHRGTVFIPELGRSFIRHPSFRLFAAQNPLQQGGGRKGLPKSFMNRFTKVYLDDLSPDDLALVCQRLFPDCQDVTLRAMIAFNTRLNEEIVSKRSFAKEGGPWEFNLRDVIRWGRLICATQPLPHPADYLGAIYLHRFRTANDRTHARLIFEQVFSTSTDHLSLRPYPALSSSDLRIGNFFIQRRNFTSGNRPGRLLQMQLPTLEAVGHCVAQSWLAIITGASDSGKTELVRTLAHLTGNILQEVSINSSTDTMDILGSFEQVHSHAHLLEIIRQTLAFVTDYSRTALGSKTVHSELHMLLQGASQTPAPLSSFPVLLRASTELLLAQIDLDEHLNNRREDLLNKIQAMTTITHEMCRFEWVDGPLVRAIRYGHWVLLDDANLCNPSVLDRLNSLCEPDGRLVLSERGFVDGQIQSLKPHPNFRLFMTTDPRYGELSRAMRNRGIEMFLQCDPTVEDGIRIHDHVRIPTTLPYQDDPRVAVVQFDAVRRGLIRQTQQVLNSDLSWPPGVHLDHYSALSYSIEQTALLSSVGPAPVMDPLLNVLARTAAPTYLPILDRLYFNLYTKVSGRLTRQIQVLLRTVLPRFFSFTAGFREEYRCSKSLPATFFSTQPADFFLTCALCPDCKLEINQPSPHRLIIETLNTWVALYTYLEERDELSVSTTHVRQPMATRKNGVATKIMKAVEAVLDAVPTTCLMLLEQLDLSNLESSLRDSELATTLIHQSRHLRTALRPELFDYSAVLAISKNMVKALHSCSSHFMKLRNHLNNLENLQSLSTGFGLNEIWSAFSGDGRTIVSPELSRPDSIVCNIKSGEDRYDLCKIIVDLMVSRSLQSMVEEPETLADLTSQKTSKNVNEAESQKIGQNEISDILAELVVLSKMGGPHQVGTSESHGQYIQHLVDMAREHAQHGILRFVVYQHLIHSPKLATTATISQCQIQWMHTLWNLEDQAVGPTIIFRPILLQGTVVKCDWSQHSLASLKEYESDLRHHRHLTNLLCEENSTRVEQVLSFLQHSVVMIISCFPQSFDSSYREFEVHISNARFGELSSMNWIVSLLERFKDQPMFDASRSLRTALLRLMNDSSSHDQIIANLGHCWMELSKFILDAYVPDLPIDPAAIQRCNLEIGLRQQSNHSSEISLHSQIENRITGNTGNAIIAFLQNRLDEASNGLVNTPSLDVRDLRNTSRLWSFWQEVLEFRSQVISSARMESLSRHLESCDENAHNREVAVQQAISGFCQRLNAVYPEYADVNTAIQLASLHLKLGLRLIAHAALCRPNIKSDALASFTTALVTFPSIQSSAMLKAIFQSSQPSVMTTSRHLLLKLASLNFEISLGVDLENYIQAVDTTYEQILRLWLIDRARKDNSETVSQSLYKSKVFSHEEGHEADVEEREFLALFPQFENIFHQEIRPQVTGNHPGLLADPAQVEMLVDIHRSMIDTSTHTTDPLKNFKKIRLSEVKDLLQMQMASLSDIVDQESYNFQFSLMAECLSNLQESSNSLQRSYNFYTDANISEVRKAGMIIDQFNKRLDDLMEEWPENMVLRHMKNRCNAILNMDLLSPVAKILSALEQLLTQSEDWENFANNENSLKAHIQAVTGLIVDWRRLELSSWRVLLQTEAKAFANGISDWWFHLYDSAVRGSLDSLNQPDTEEVDHVTVHLSKLCPLLDGFMRTSPLGQYHSRLQLLRSFSKYVGHLALIKPVQICAGLRRVERVLQTTAQYYEQFNSSVSSQLAEQQAVIEKDLQGFIKLASWKDTNVYSLKQSAQRTHRQLYKCVRQFRNIMRQPVVQWLQHGQETVIEPKLLPEIVSGEELVSSTTVPLFPRKPLTETWPTHLSNLDQTFQKFVVLTTGPIRSAVESRTTTTTVMEDLAVEIISTTKMLSSLSIPINESIDKREKLRKSRLMRKRRAWSDLLKELKRAGLAANMKPDELCRLRDTRWIREQPGSTDLPKKSASIIKSDIYLCRLYGLLPDLRVSLADHHSDLSTRELQRGINFLESGFAMALESKSCLIAALADLHNLENISRRLKMAQSSSETLQTHPELLKVVIRIKDTVCGFASALDEIVQSLHADDVLQLNSASSVLVLDEISTIAAKTATFRDSISAVLGDMKLTSVQFLLPSEHVVIQDVLRHIHDSSERLFRISENEPRLAHLLRPVRNWLAMQRITLPSFSPQLSVRPKIDTDVLINAVLINIQNLLAACPDPRGAQISHERDLYIRTDHDLICKFTHLLKLADTLDQINNTLLELTVQSHDVLQYNLARLLPFLDRYLHLAKEHLTAHSQWMKALCKLDYVLCSVMHTLAKQGFCQPPESNESQLGDDVGESGVGIGEGAGTENVSKEIEEESQVEGLKNNEGDSTERQDRSKEDAAIEISEDFDGNMEDVPDTSSQDGDDSDSESQAELEDQHAELDSADPSAVDEKLWGDEKAEPGQADEKSNQGPSEKQDGSRDIAAKENSSTKTDMQNDLQNQNDHTDEILSEVSDVDGDDHQPDIGNALMDEFVPESDILDLPDDMNFDEEKEEKKDSDIDMMDDEIDGPSDAEGDTSEIQARDEHEHVDPNEEHQSAETEGSRREGDGEDPETQDEADIRQPDVSAGQGAFSANNPTQPSRAEDPGTAEQCDESLDSAGQRPDTSEIPGSQDQSMEIADDAKMTDSGNARLASSGSRQDPGPIPQSEHSSTKPPRLQGDVLESTRRPLEEIQHGDDTTDVPRNHLASMTDEPQLEYLRADDPDHDMQALGPADTEKVAKLQELNIVDDSPDELGQAMEVDAFPNIEERKPAMEEFGDSTETTTNGIREDTDVEGAVVPGADRPAVHDDVFCLSDGQPVPADFEMIDNTSDADVEAELRVWQAAGLPDDGTEYLWRRYESMTHDLAYALCEQLRLILEPTLATRLKGDYRTGKRLNMKKIIPYIASDYTKDKIWLRRTRPSQREYQVLIALDDSRSMSESHSVHLAYQTLALVSKALGRLEVGDLAVVKFGESMEILHGFDEGPFTDQAGMKVLSAFRFGQTSTNVSSLLNASLRMLEDARERRSISSRSVADLWQLEIIISDGICQDHERLRTILRKAEEQRVMIVFIIIDSLSSTVRSSIGASPAASQRGLQNSILSMNQAAYKMIDGRMELQMQRYLDTFPFEYHVVLRNVEALPEVLSATLKQFFERISEQ